MDGIQPPPVPSPVPDSLVGHCFPKGQSGNPGGRPATRKARAAISKMKPAALKALQDALEKGEAWAVTLWFAYFYGKPVEAHELTGADGDALQVSISIIRTVKSESNAAPTGEP